MDSTSTSLKNYKRCYEVNSQALDGVSIFWLSPRGERNPIEPWWIGERTLSELITHLRSKGYISFDEAQQA